MSLNIQRQGLLLRELVALNTSAAGSVLKDRFIFQILAQFYLPCFTP